MAKFEIPRYKDLITLIPGGCPQILDYEAPLADLKKVKYYFEETRVRDEAGKDKVHLHAYRKNDDGDWADEMNLDKVVYESDGYSRDGAKVLAPWLNKWLPMPFFRKREQTWPDSGDCRFEYGPSNWARGRLALDKQNPELLKLTLAFDMQVEEREGDLYTAISQDDVDANAHFKLAWRFRDNAWFLDLKWVDEWLSEVWNAYRQENRIKPKDDDPQFDYLASYLTLLGAINVACDNCEVKLIRPDGKSCVEVDLILDVGNSRTTGLLVETQTQSTTNLNDSYLLQLRDMSEPENVYLDPFETRVEFSEISFGNDALSLRSGRRRPAFSWPSPVRIGPEAARLCALSRCGEGSTGMSSPKRYLWDERDWQKTWRFNTTTTKAPFVTRGPLAQRINSSGTPLCCMEDAHFKRNPILRAQEQESAFESLFTRSSLMMFLMVEIIQQALLTINSPGERLRHSMPNLPRRLRQIIFTAPPGMPIAELNIYKRWANWAVRVLWEALGWTHFYRENPKKTAPAGGRDYRESPVVRCEWDEATCTQLVYVYNEITQKYLGDAKFFFDTSGRLREINGRKDAPSVRVATIDIGGGTTDLSITTFELTSSAGSTPRVAPHPEFHDGFNVAGDDILRAVIEEQVLPPIADALRKAGVANSGDIVRTLFGRKTMHSDKDMADQRAQFVRQVAVPVALCLLSLYEKADLRKGTGRVNFRLRDCFLPLPEEIAAKAAREKQQVEEGDESGEAVADQRVELPCDIYTPPSPNALDYVGNIARSRGDDPEFNVLDIPISMDPRQMDITVKSALAPVLANLCEVINQYDCDALLLTGRPSRWPGIVNTIYSLLPLPPSRIYPMADYRVGGWYPFSDALGKMTDPKTTVVVGAILCALAEGQLEGFSFDPGALHVTSTARFIGEMEITGQIKKEKVWFKVEPDKRLVSPEEIVVEFSAPMSIGFRQLEAERWTTTRYHFLEWVNDEARARNSGGLPLKVKLKFVLPEIEEEEANAANARDEGEFEVLSIVDSKGEEPQGRQPVQMRLQTLPRNEGFWLDTGVIYESGSV